MPFKCSQNVRVDVSSAWRIPVGSMMTPGEVSSSPWGYPKLDGWFQGKSQSKIWLVVWNIFIFPYIGNNHTNWLIFFRGVQTTNQKWMMKLGVPVIFRKPPYHKLNHTYWSYKPTWLSTSHTGGPPILGKLHFFTSLLLFGAAFDHMWFDCCKMTQNLNGSIALYFDDHPNFRNWPRDHWPSLCSHWTQVPL